MDWLTQYAWIGALLFARLGSVLMIAPGWGEQAAPANMRLAVAVLATAALAPSLAGAAPPPPASAAGAIPLILVEVLIGLLLGSGARLFMSALAVAGATAGIASGLGFAQQIDPVQNQNSAIFSAFFSLMGVVLLMAMGLHRIMLQAAADSYAVFPPGAFPMIGDAAQHVIGAVADSFRLGVQIAAPVLVFSLLFNLSLGLINRLLPQIQVFLIAMPLSVLLGVSVIALGLGGGLMLWLSEMERQTLYFTTR